MNIRKPTPGKLLRIFLKISVKFYHRMNYRLLKSFIFMNDIILFLTIKY